MYEPHDALTHLLAVIGRGGHPAQSLRVARALRRVVVRELERRVSSALQQADQDMEHATSVRDALRAGVSPRGLVVLAESLVVLRPDRRSLGLAGRARSVAQRCGTG